MKKRIVGIAIGGTKTAVSHALFDGEFHINQKYVFLTEIIKIFRSKVTE